MAAVLAPLVVQLIRGGGIGRFALRWKRRAMPDRRQRLLEGLSDNRYLEAVALVLQTRCATTSHLQIGLGIGYPYARRLQETMVEDGVLAPRDEVGRHQVLLPPPH